MITLEKKIKENKYYDSTFNKKDNNIKELETQLKDNPNYECIHYLASRTQRICELKLGLGLDGTNTYKKCYDCDGKNKICSQYLSKKLFSEEDLPIYN